MDFYFIIQEKTTLILSPVLCLLPSKQIHVCLVINMTHFYMCFLLLKQKNVNMNKVTYYTSTYLKV